MADSNKSKFSNNLSGSKSNASDNASSLLYGRQFYMWMLIGFLVMILGFALMAGGKQLPTEWNPDEIYSVRRTIIAPIVILIGLGIEIYAIFKK